MTAKSIQSRSASYRLLAEVLQNDIGLEDASSELQDDRDVVLHCVRRCPAAIEHASARLRGDKEIILAAATGEYDEALKFASAELQDDWDFVLHLVKVPWRGDAVKYASARLRGDKEIILAAIEEGFSMFALKYASSELQDDREFVLECVQLAPNGSHAIYHASDRLRGDKEIILSAESRCTALRYASAELQDDRDVVLHCVKETGVALYYASARLRGDKEIILAAAWSFSDTVLDLASAELQDDRDVVLHCVKNGGDAIKHASARLRGDKEIILAAGRKCSSDTVLNLASTELQDDRDVVLRCVELKPDAIKYASSRLRRDKEIILAAEETRAFLLESDYWGESDY